MLPIYHGLSSCLNLMQAEEQELALTSVRLPEAPVDLELFIHNHFITQAPERWHGNIALKLTFLTKTTPSINCTGRYSNQLYHRNFLL